MTSLHPSLVTSYLPIFGAPNDPENQKDAMAKRLAQHLPTADPGLFQEFTEYVRHRVDELFDPIAVEPDFEEWIEHTPYPAWRKTELRLVHSDLQGHLPNRRQREKINSFVKIESYPETKYCRMINARSDAVKVTLGPAFHAIEERMFALPWFAKHFRGPGQLVEQLSAAPNGYVTATDFSAFEAHMTVDVLNAVEFQLYRRCLQNFPKLVQFIERTIGGRNRLATRDGARMTLKGRRMSGDMCTSLGNTFTNWMVSEFVALKSGARLRFKIFEGDDGLMVSDAPIDEAWYARLGFICKAEHHDRVSEASFCGKVFANGQVIRDPRTVIQTCAFSDRAVGAGQQVRNELLKAKGMSMCYETPHCPIVRPLGEALVKLAGDAVARYVYDGYHEQQHGELPVFAPSPETRALFEARYGWSPSAQKAMEARLAAGDFGVLEEIVECTRGAALMWDFGCS